MHSRVCQLQGQAWKTGARSTSTRRPDRLTVSLRAFDTVRESRKCLDSTFSAVSNGGQVDAGVPLHQLAVVGLELTRRDRGEVQTQGG